VRLVLTKLQEKTQTPAQQQQAAQAVARYLALVRAQEKIPETLSAGGLPRQRERLPQPAPLPARGGTSADSLRGKGAPVVPTEWENIAQRLAEEIKTRHSSPKTLQAYALWATTCRSFPGDQTPDSVSAAEGNASLPYLAVTCKVSASMQNQAFHALLVLFWHVLLKLPQLCHPSLAGQCGLSLRCREPDLGRHPS